MAIMFRKKRLSMDTTRVDICYRPLRIAWAIQSDDFESFRQASYRPARPKTLL